MLEGNHIWVIYYKPDYSILYGFRSHEALMEKWNRDGYGIATDLFGVECINLSWTLWMAHEGDAE